MDRLRRGPDREISAYVTTALIRQDQVGRLGEFVDWLVAEHGPRRRGEKGC
ncbi:hypothetical protein ACW4TU_25745 [Streptomyces sp. QTS52]